MARQTSEEDSALYANLNASSSTSLPYDSTSTPWLSLCVRGAWPMTRTYLPAARSTLPLSNGKVQRLWQRSSMVEMGIGDMDGKDHWWEEDVHAGN